MTLRFPWLSWAHFRALDAAAARADRTVSPGVAVAEALRAGYARAMRQKLWRLSLGFRGRAEMHRGDAHGVCARGHRQEYEQWYCMFRDFQRLNPQRGLETPDWWMVVWWCGGKCTSRFHVEHTDDATLPATWWEGSLDWEPEDPAVDILWSHKKLPLVGVFFLDCPPTRLTTNLSRTQFIL